jgi:thioredoxin 1
MPVGNISSQNWEDEVLKSDTLVLVDFWAPWCPWCRKLSPEFDSLSDQYTGKVKFAKVNTEESHDIAERYGVEGLPTLKFFCQGRPIAELVGYLPEPVLKSEIDKIFQIQKTCIGQSSPTK